MRVRISVLTGGSSRDIVVMVDGGWNEKTMIGKEKMGTKRYLGNEFLPGCTEKEGPGH